MSMGTRITSIEDLIGKPPLRDTGSLKDGKATLRLANDPVKECFDFFRDFEASVSLNEGDYLPLSIGVMLDISGSGAEACVSSQHLDIPQAAANLADPPRCTRDERPPAAMARTADHPEPGIQPVKPHSDRACRQTSVPLAMDDRPIWMCPAVSLFMESHERCLKVRVHWNMATAAFTLGRPVFQRDHIADFSLGIGDHRPSDSRDLLCPQPDFSESMNMTRSRRG
jgi:hypothetical protein